MLLAFSEQRPGMLPNVLQSTTQPHHKDLSSPSANRAEAEQPRVRLYMERKKHSHSLRSVHGTLPGWS